MQITKSITSARFREEDNTYFIWYIGGEELG